MHLDDSTSALAFLQNDPAAVHLVGACGSGMSSLAGLLLQMGCGVTGSDLAAPTISLRQLQRLGARVVLGHDATHVPAATRLLVHSPAVSPTNPELTEARRLGIPVLSYTQMLGQLMRDREGIAIAGTHGKSTTTALLGWILQQADLEPSIVVGAEMRGSNSGGRFGRGRQILVEACEYRRGFLDLKPEMAVLLGLEPDHFDCFASPAEALDAFTEFASSVPDDGVLFANADCPQTRNLAESTATHVTWFSRSQFNGWRVSDVCPVETGLLFRVHHGANTHSDVELPLSGRHHVHNALAAIAVAAELGVRAEQIESAVASFPGLRRRFEDLGTHAGVTIVDDYAHHPTAITGTIRAARSRYPNRRVVCVYEPHQYSRAHSLFDEFTLALSAADEVLITPVFTARETVSSDVCDELTKRMAAAIQTKETRAHMCASLDHVLATLDDSLQPGDVLLTMGAGQVDRIPHEFIGRFSKHSEAG